MSTDWRSLCEALVDEWDAVTDQDLLAMDEAVERARAALAEPQEAGPTDQQLAEAFAEGCREGSKAGEPAFLGGARAVLARWGRPTPPPAAGEVGELVEGLRLISDGMSAIGHESDSWFVARAADLLTRLALQPVPVSERLPGAEDCLDEGWAWFFNPRTGWRQATQPVHSTYTHWLPAQALPLPREVQP